MYSQRPIEPDKVVRVPRHTWADNFFRPALVVAMILCLNYAVVKLTWLINPTWDATYFLVGMFLTTVEAIFSFRILHHHRMRGGSVLRYRLVELGLLLLVLKLLSYMNKPWDAIYIEIVNLWQYPELLFDTEFYVLIVLAILAWTAATYTVEDIEALYDPYQDSRLALESLTGRFFWGGAILLVISGITRWVAVAGTESLIDLYRPSLGGIVFNVLLYFLLGFVLLSQVNLTRLHVRWKVQEIPVVGGLSRRWARYGVIFLVGVSLVAFVLPTHFTMGFLETAGIVLGVIIQGIIFLFYLLVALLTLPFALLFSLLTGTTPPANEPLPPAPPPALPPTPDSAAPPWLDIMRSIVFWGVALAAIIYLVKTYFDDRPELLHRLKNFKLIALLRQLLADLSQLLGRWTRAGLDLLPDRLKTPGPVEPLASIRGRNWLRLRHLSPRQRILRYYLNVLEQAEKKGRARQQGQTPYEYEPSLRDSLPNVELDIQQITEVFVRARYSQEDFDQKQATLVRRYWSRIKKAFRRRESGSPPAP